MTAAVHWSSVDDIDDALAADFDGSLSGLGMELGTGSFNMSEALMALPNLSALKQEHHSHHNHHNHSHHLHNNVNHSSANHQNSRNSHHSEGTTTHRNSSVSPLLHSNAEEANCPIAVVHGKKNRLTYGTEDELVTTAIKRFCLSNEWESNLNEHNNRFLISNNYLNDDECNDECANDIRCQHRHSSSVPDLRTTVTGAVNQSHSTASSPSSSSTPTPTTNSVLAQILSVPQYVTGSPSPTREVVANNSLSTRSTAKFQYVLGAATSMAMKLHEETMTYLNQGQSYEIKLKKVGDLREIRGKMLKTIVKVGFQERRLQYMEKELISQWKQQRPSDRILEIDVPLTYGVHDIFDDPKHVNRCEFFWDPTKETGVFVKVNCISTEFTPKKHGGEKGVPFRIVIETYPHNGTSPSSCLHAASCQVKVFKPKGADRKHKTDREKMGKKPHSEQEKFQPSYDCTVFTDCSLDSLFSFSAPASQSTSNTISSTDANPKSIESNKCLSPEHSSTPKPISISSFYESDSSHDLISNCLPTTPSINSTFKPLAVDSDADQTTKWLQLNRFNSYIRTFSNFAGSDILRLSREDLIQICGLTDGIRLYNALHARNIRPRLTIYVCLQNDEVFRAVYLENLSVKELTTKLSAILVSNNKMSLTRICMWGPSGIRILVTDDVVRNLSEESMFLVELNKDQSGDKLQALLKPYNN
ncbi:transcription factor CP2-like [Oppia nitens]|uniref:transcription factor CP2-like n=1 Tax=Oppia nitens TaxID=1686743 RepID=UPI0023DBE2B5|nr:transcription factor CP2-like [Oppia nitens]